MRLVDADKILEKLETGLDNPEEFPVMGLGAIMRLINNEPEVQSAQPEQRYTKKELEIFKHGISISLLSKRSSQHWFYDEETAKEIELLERLYKKVEDDMKGEQNDGARDR